MKQTGWKSECHSVHSDSSDSIQIAVLCSDSSFRQQLTIRIQQFIAVQIEHRWLGGWVVVAAAEPPPRPSDVGAEQTPRSRVWVGAAVAAVASAVGVEPAFFILTAVCVDIMEAPKSATQTKRGGHG